ncbi:MAG: SocA family protein [Marinospirillum sp.]|uniref:Panacea domain-containing protein n=1 Tax=Marinospirillum sp. TaxID=2183934 RepID=UPI001A0BEC25|nr:Panacea domain-containing protein [Marinospirillum sp.]MBE0507712.1 SocA family protein [Marinospirillum sp.]
MLITHEREKMIQAIIFFAKNTRYCGKVKLFKLLYFLDFEHFKTTGRSVTGLTYSAWPMGPVPVALYGELDCPEPDLAEAVKISEIATGRMPMLSFDPLVDFSADHFTRREMKLMQQLAHEYADCKSEEIIEATHLENLPWDRVFNKEGKKQAEIPYSYALRASEAEEMMQMVGERQEFMQAIA